jgi:hypothetical protein
LISDDLAWARNRSKTRQDNDPIVLGPKQPAAVDEDDFTNEVCERDKEICAYELVRLVGEIIDASS